MPESIVQVASDNIANVLILCRPRSSRFYCSQATSPTLQLIAGAEEDPALISHTCHTQLHVSSSNTDVYPTTAYNH